MPTKKCEGCQEANGVRAKKCKGCGEKFPDKKNPPYIPGGYWQHDEKGRPKGLPEILPPPPLSKGLLDNEEVKDYVTYEGVPDSIELIPTKKIKDKELRKLWGKAQMAISEVKAFVYGE